VVGQARNLTTCGVPGPPGQLLLGNCRQALALVLSFCAGRYNMRGVDRSGYATADQYGAGHQGTAPRQGAFRADAAGGNVPRGPRGPPNKGLSMQEIQRALMEEEMIEERDAQMHQRRINTDRPPREGLPPEDRARAQNLASSRQIRAERGIGLDTHELLKREAFASDVPGCDSHFEKNRPCPDAPHGVSDQYIILDSYQKLPESDIGRGVFRWNFMVQGITGDNTLGVRDVVDTVIEIEIGSFPMPVLPEVPYVLHETATTLTTQFLVLVHNNSNGASGPPQLLGTQYPENVAPVPGTAFSPWVNNPYTQVPFGGRFTVQVGEAGLQSYSDNNGARHSFEFELTSPASLGSNPTMLLAAPTSGTYVYTDPLKDVHGITLTFRNPDVPLSFLPDCYYDAVLELDGAASPGPYVRIRAPGHGLSAGDRVYITGLKTGASVLDAYVNRVAGHVAAGNPTLGPLAPGTPIILADPDVFYTDPAISVLQLTAPVPVLPQSIVLYVAKRRLRIPMRLRRVVPRLTNYIVAI
jgi:hypothetical protein